MHPVQRLLSTVHLLLDGVDEPALFGLSDHDVDLLISSCERAASRLQTRSADLIAEACRRRRPVAVGGSSPGVWLAGLLAVNHAEGMRLASRARVLDATTGDPVATPIVTDARRGRIGIEHAAAAAKAVTALPEDLSPDQREACVSEMRMHARALDPAGVAAVGAHLLEVVDPDRAEAELGRRLADQDRRATQARGLVVGRVRDGVVRGRFALPAADVATVRAALEPLAAPHPAVAADDSGIPVRDPRTHPQRMADALVGLCDRALDSASLPTAGGERPQLAITIDWDSLRARISGGQLLDGTDLAPDVARRVACDAGILPVVLGGSGQPLDVGRETRSVPAGLRRALIVRDRGCAFPGCDRPAAWCDAHHIRHWCDGGPTRMDNLVLLCGYHHHYLHGDAGWEIRIRSQDGRPEWLPPPWLDPGRTPVPGRLPRPPELRCPARELAGGLSARTAATPDAAVDVLEHV